MVLRCIPYNFDPKTCERLKRMVFTQTKRDRIQSFFKATNSTKTNKSLNSHQLDSCRRKWAWDRCQSRAHFCKIQLVTAKWFVCFCIDHRFEKEDFQKKNACCFVWLKSVLCNLLQFLDLFFRMPAVSSFSCNFVIAIIICDLLSVGSSTLIICTFCALTRKRKRERDRVLLNYR